MRKQGWTTESGGRFKAEQKIGNRYPDLVITKGNKRVAIQVGRATKGKTSESRAKSYSRLEE